MNKQQQKRIMLIREAINDIENGLNGKRYKEWLAEHVAEITKGVGQS